MSLDAKIEYLKMIQAIIARMSHYGFLLKGWGVTLIAAVLALAAQSGEPDLLLIGLFPTVVFWALDAFFLHTERNYRALYDHAARLSPDQVDFALSPTGEHARHTASLWRIMLSRTLLVFWFAIVVVLILGYGMIGDGWLTVRVLCSCPLSPWERARVRVLQFHGLDPVTPTLSQGWRGS